MTEIKDPQVLLEVKNLKKYFKMRKAHQILKAVDDVSFVIRCGETFGLVGESGCGKTTIGRTINRIYCPTDGQILIDGTDIAQMNERQLRPFRTRIQMIFQDPYASLNPRMTIGDIVGEPLDIHKLLKGIQRQKKIEDLLESVGLAREYCSRYPHEFSGGQRQRIGVARALALEPDLIICDEPISALDVSIQAQVVNLLEDLQKNTNIAYLFIAHDLSMVQHISHRIGVMYLGHLVEVAESRELYRNPMHPYTKALLSAIPIPDPDASASHRRILLTGEVPTPINPPKGCPFISRCPHVTDKCRLEKPEQKEYGSDHQVACWYIEQQAEKLD